jgi:thiol:disulfide interchange protein DsbD
MNTARRLFAFPMYGATAWLIWVMSQQAGQAGLGALLMAMLGLGFSAWMYGLAQNRLASGGSTKPLYALAGISLAVMAVVMVESGLQPMMASAKSERSAPRLAATAPMTWSPELVASLRTQHKPILINFTAAWCVTCQVNDRVALSTGKVRQALQTTGTAYLVADSTKFDPAIQSALAHYGRGGLPVYVVYPADGGAPVLLPQILTPGIVVDALQAGARS